MSKEREEHSVKERGFQRNCKGLFLLKKIIRAKKGWEVGTHILLFCFPCFKYSINKKLNKNPKHKLQFFVVQIHYFESYFSPKAFLQNSAASALVIRNVSPWKSPLGKIPFSSASMWLKIRDSLVRFRLQMIRSAMIKWTHKIIFILNVLNSLYQVCNL